MSEETHTEWGVRLTWPDGHEEVRTRNRLTSEPYSRRDVEVATMSINADQQDGHTQATAEPVSRTVRIGEWVPVDKVVIAPVAAYLLTDAPGFEVQP